MRQTLLLIISLMAGLAYGQSAKAVLDKAAAVVSAKGGAQAQFTIKGENMSTSGTIAIKGRKFHAAVPQAIVWFDGKTQWTYMKKNDEVNVANPTDAELARINPYNFIYMYKQGYDATATKKGTSHELHLTTKDKKKAIQEMYITVSQKTYVPSQIRMRQKSGWTTIDIRNFKQVSLADATFRFNAKDYPTAEVIDLR